MERMIVPNAEERPPSMQVDEKKLIECRHNCDAKFDSFKLLNRHILTEHREIVEQKLSKCKYCDERIRKTLMWRHLQNEHSLCKMEGCDKRLPQFALQCHMAREHGDGSVRKEKVKKKKKNKVSRKCPVTGCDREFKKGPHLKKHMKNSHTEEEILRPCVHDECKQTLTPWAMKQHILKEHGKQFEKRECKICNVICTSKQGWKKHRKNHVKEYFNRTDETVYIERNIELNAPFTLDLDDSIGDASEDDSSEENSDYY